MTVTSQPPQRDSCAPFVLYAWSGVLSSLPLERRCEENWMQKRAGANSHHFFASQTIPKCYSFNYR